MSQEFDPKDIVRALITATEEGRVDWKVSPDEMLSVYDNAVGFRVFHYEDEDLSSGIAFHVMDGAKVIDTLTADDDTLDHPLLEKLLTVARRKAYNVEKRVTSILNKIKDGGHLG